MKDKPLISVIVPVYNVEVYLSQCLDSILEQTYTNIEAICVNDGSSDSSGMILQNYANQDKRVKIINQSNQGPSGTRNTALNVANGDYVMFVDGDDWIDLTTCEKVVAIARQHDADVVFWSYISEHERTSKEKRLPWTDGRLFSKSEVQEQLQRRLCGLTGEELRRPELANAVEPVWGKLYRKEILNNIAFVDTKKIGTAEDALFNLYAFKNVNRAVYFDKCLYHYRRTNQNAFTSCYKPNLFTQWNRLFELMESFIKENNLPAEFNEGLNNRIALSIIGLSLNIDSSSMSFWEKSRAIKNILKSEVYKSAISKLSLRSFPIHWAVFFGCAKYKIACAVLLMIKAMQCLRRRI